MSIASINMDELTYDSLLLTCTEEEQLLSLLHGNNISEFGFGNTINEQKISSPIDLHSSSVISDNSFYPHHQCSGTSCLSSSGWELGGAAPATSLWSSQPHVSSTLTSITANDDDDDNDDDDFIKGYDVHPGILYPGYLESIKEEQMEEEYSSPTYEYSNPESLSSELDSSSEKKEIPTIKVESIPIFSFTGLAPAHIQIHTLRLQKKKLVAKDRIFDIHFLVEGIPDCHYVTCPEPEKWHPTKPRDFVLKIRMHDSHTGKSLHPNVAVCVKRLTKNKELKFDKGQTSFSVVIRKASVDDWPPVRRCTKREFKLVGWLEKRDENTGEFKQISSITQSETILWAGNRRIAAKATLCELKPWSVRNGSGAIQWPAASPPPSPDRPGHSRSRSVSTEYMRTVGLKRKDETPTFLENPHAHHEKRLSLNLTAPVVFDHEAKKMRYFGDNNVHKDRDTASSVLLKNPMISSGRAEDQFHISHFH